MRVLISVIIMLFVTSIVTAQDTNIIYIEVVSDDSIDDSYQSEFIDLLTETLQDENYELVVNSTQFEANIRIEFTVSEDGVQRISVLPLTPTELSASPILYAQWSQPYLHQFDDWEQDKEDLVVLTTGLALYSVEDCVLALNYYLYRVDNFYTSFYSGNCYLEFSEYERAHYEFSNSVSSPDYIPVYVNHAWTMLQIDSEWVDRYGNERDFSFEANLGRILLTWLEPDEKVDTLARRAQIYALAFDYDSAIADMDEAISIAEENELDSGRLAELYTVRGQIIFLIYEWDRVEENFTTAIEIDPDYAPAYFERGILFYTMARREDALADFETYLELDPDGLHAEEAASYIESIQIEIDALGG